MHLFGIWTLMAALQVVVLGGEAESSLSGKQGSLPCVRGFTQREYIIEMDQDLAKGQAVFNGSHSVHEHTAIILFALYNSIPDGLNIPNLKDVPEAFSSGNSCSDLDVYLRGPLSQYLLNVSTAAELCSQTLCSSHGRCLRKNPDSDVYLHLNPLTHFIVSASGKPTVTGELSEAEKMRFQTEFQCQCYSGYQGEGCVQTDPLHQRGAASQTTTPALLCVILLSLSLLLC